MDMSRVKDDGIVPSELQYREKNTDSATMTVRETVRGFSDMG